MICPPPLLADCRGTAVHHSAAGPPQHHPAAASSAPCRRGRRRPWSLPRQRPHKLRPIPISQFPIILLSLFCQCQKRPAGIRRALLVYRDIPICQSLSLWEQQRRPPPAAETGRSCWGRGQQDARPAPRAEADAGHRKRALIPLTERKALELDVQEAIFGAAVSRMRGPPKGRSRRWAPQEGADAVNRTNKHIGA